MAKAKNDGESTNFTELSEEANETCSDAQELIKQIKEEKTPTGESVKELNIKVQEFNDDIDDIINDLETMEVPEKEKSKFNTNRKAVTKKLTTTKKQLNDAMNKLEVTANKLQQKNAAADAKSQTSKGSSKKSKKNEKADDTKSVEGEEIQHAIEGRDDETDPEMEDEDELVASDQITDRIDEDEKDKKSKNKEKTADDAKKTKEKVKEDKKKDKIHKNEEKSNSKKKKGKTEKEDNVEEKNSIQEEEEEIPEEIESVEEDLNNDAIAASDQVEDTAKNKNEDKKSRKKLGKKDEKKSESTKESKKLDKSEKKKGKGKKDEIIDEHQNEEDVDIEEEGVDELEETKEAEAVKSDSNLKLNKSGKLKIGKKDDKKKAKDDTKESKETKSDKKDKKDDKKASKKDKNVKNDKDKNEKDESTSLKDEISENEKEELVSEKQDDEIDDQEKTEEIVEKPQAKKRTKITQEIKKDEDIEKDEVVEDSKFAEKSQTDLTEDKKDFDSEVEDENITDPKLKDKKMIAKKAQSLESANDASLEFSNLQNNKNDQYKLIRNIELNELEEPDDLGGQKGEIVTVLEKNDDGFWFVKKDDKEGFMPESALKPVQNGDQNDSTSEANQNEDSVITSKSKDDDEQEISGRLDQDCTWEAQNSSPSKESSAKVLHEIKEKRQKGIKQKLKFYGGLPSGFRYSTLAQWQKDPSKRNSMSQYLMPKLTQSGLNYRDIAFMNHKIVQRNAKFQRLLQLQKLVNVPFTGEKFVIVSRQARICLFNSKACVSNILVMRCHANDKDQRVWTFGTKAASVTAGGGGGGTDASSLDCAECFIRYNPTSSQIMALPSDVASGENVSLLIEFTAIGYKNTSAVKAVVATAAGGGAEQASEAESQASSTGTGLRKTISFNQLSKLSPDQKMPKYTDLDEFSIGWVAIPLFNQSTNAPIDIKYHEFTLNGGSPFERDVEVDPNLTNQPAAGAFTRAPKPTQIQLKFLSINKESKDLLDTLPDVLLANSNHLQILSMFRQCLAHELFTTRDELTNCTPIYSQLLTPFVEISNYWDLLDATRNIFNEKLKTNRPAVDKKNIESMRNSFKWIFVDFIYPISKVLHLPPLRVGDTKNEVARQRMIDEMLRLARIDRLNLFCGDQFQFAPYDIEENLFRLVNPNESAHLSSMIST